MSSPRKPRVTVLMPVYNGASQLDATIKSVLRQTFRDFEFIIVNDGSTDGTADLLARWARKDRRIRLFHNRPNQGIVRSMNKGLKAARTPLVARIDCGDICAPGRLALQHERFRSDPSLVLLGTQINRVNEEGKVVGWTSLPEGDAAIRRALFCRKSVIAHPSAMYRRIRGLHYRENAYPSEDYDYWLRIAERGGVDILPQRLVDLVNDPGSISHKNMVKQVLIVGRIRGLLLERLRYGSERSALPNFRKLDHWRWTAATRLYGFKIARNYYRYHPMNFVINLAMALLCPATFIARTPWPRLAPFFYAREFRRFLALGKGPAA